MNNIKDIFCGLDKCIISKMINDINNVRYLNYEFYKYPDVVISCLMKENNNCKKAYIPIDIVEIKKYLSKEYFKDIKSGFSFNFAKRYFLDYPIWLGVNFKNSKIDGNYYHDIEEADICDIFINANCVNQKKENDIFEIIRSVDKRLECLTRVFRVETILTVPKIASASSELPLPKGRGFLFH